MITSISDYKGKYKLSTGMYDQAKIQDYIDRYEPRYLRELLGVELYNQFESDLDGGVPQSPNLLKIYNALYEDIGSFFYHWKRVYEMYDQIESEGIKEMLKGFIYFEYAKDLVNEMTPYGNVKPNAENSEVANTLFSMIYTRYNEAIRSYQSIQDYIILNQDVELGQAINVTLLNGGNNYVDDTNVATIGGSGTGCTIDIATDGMGVIQKIVVNNPGKDYIIGDTLLIDAGDVDADFVIDYVGIGDYKLFKGQKKVNAYWI
jgi:hypothetical protein